MVLQLGTAKNKIQQGNTNAAKDQLGAFQSQVKTYRGNRIQAEQADTLMAEAQKIIDSL